MRKLRQPRTLTLDEIRQLYTHAEPQERTFLLLGLNCGYGPSEILALKPSSLFLRQRHPHAESLGIESTPEDSFVGQRRPKTGVWIEHLLWRETAQLLSDVVAQRTARTLNKSADSNNEDSLALDEHLFSYKGRTCSACGATVAGELPGRKILYAWDRLIRRIRKDNPDFPRQSFGLLRKTGVDLLARVGAENETLGLFLGHTPHPPQRMIARPPFQQLVEAIREVEELVAPALAP